MTTVLAYSCIFGIWVLSPVLGEVSCGVSMIYWWLRVCWLLRLEDAELRVVFERDSRILRKFGPSR